MKIFECIKNFIFLFLSVVLLISAGCIKKDINLASEKYVDLRNTLHKYYDFEKKKKWAETYLMRTPNFRQTVEKDTYISIMEEDSKGWLLHEFSILSAIKNKEEIVVKIKFLESFPKGSDFGKSLGGQFDKNHFIDYSVWKKIEGQWYCKAAGTRAHLSLNSALEE